MPVVFVHGVSNRDGDEYQHRQRVRGEYLKSIVYKKLGWLYDNARVFNPYWGQYGANPAWNMACLPQNAPVPFETFGSVTSFDLAHHGWSEEDTRTAALIPIVDGSHAPGTYLCELARRQGLPIAVDTLWSVSLDIDQRVDDAVFAQTIETAGDIVAYAEANRRPAWLAEIRTDGELVAKLISEVSSQEYEAQGGGWEVLQEGLSRLVSVPGRMTGDIAVALWRKKLTESVVLFLGDIFVYLDGRERDGVQSKILRAVLSDLARAHIARVAGDSSLIVISHSLGALLCYDLFTKFQDSLSPGFTVDAWITVGSQASVFGELNTLGTKWPPEERPNKLARPSCVANWINVFDEGDLFGYAYSGVFNGVADYRYNTAATLLTAHGAYFLRPSFYERMRARLEP